MQQQVNTPTLTDVLASNYMLVRLHIRIWSGKRTDQAAAREFLSQKGASSDAAVFVKNLLAGNDAKLKKVKSAYTTLRSFFYWESSPWTSATSGPMKGDRLIATRNSLDFLKKFSKLKKEAEDALTEFVQHYETAVQNAMQNLGSLYDPTQYPSKAAVRSLFDARLEMHPVPNVTDYERLHIPAELAEGLKEIYERSAKRQMDNALADMQERLLTELDRTAVQLGRVERGENTRLYRSMRTNLERLVQMAREINFTNSTEINDLADDIQERLLVYGLDDYKDNAALAGSVARHAKQLAERVRAKEWRVSAEEDAPLQVPEEPTPEIATEDDQFVADLVTTIKEEIDTDDFNFEDVYK